MLMENPSASIPAASPGDPSITTPQPERPEQGKFSVEETSFLKTYLPVYRALCDQLGAQATGPRGTGLVKGRKKDWVISKVFPDFVKKFLSDEDEGPQLQSLQDKMLRWFTNRSPNRDPGSGSKALTRVTSKRPRATNGANIFAEEHKAKITERMAEEQDQEGGVPKQVNLRRYQTIKKELYDNLPDEGRRAYEAKAAKKNEAFKAQPETSEVFKNQEDITGGVAKALHDLIGWDWGQYGDAVFFVQGAYRNTDNDLKTFNVSVSPNANITNFSSTLPGYKEILRVPFREWAKVALPVRSSPIKGATDTAGHQKYTINLQTSTRDIPNSDVDADPEISGLHPPGTHRADDEPPIASPRDVDTDNAAAELDNGISEISYSQGPAKRTANSEPFTTSPSDEDNNDLGLPLLASGASIASPVIEPPSQSSPPLSESITKVAIQKPSEAGYLGDISAIDVPNQVLQHFETSQQGGKAKTRNSNSKKRGREETEQGGPSEDKQTKKRRGKPVIPPREQSSRLKDANYRNKHITVRPR